MGRHIHLGDLKRQLVLLRSELEQIINKHDLNYDIREDISNTIIIVHKLIETLTFEEDE